jgi:3-phosphoshikimate 1-carboxyvinyltransferase
MLNQTDTLMVFPGRPLNGEIGGANEPALPGDKSLSHRAALLAAMAAGESRIENFQVSGVTRAMLEALSALDVPWRLDGKTLYVKGVGLGRAVDSGQLACPVRQGAWLHCGNSATTLRLLAGALAAWGASATLDGSPGLRSRPMNRIVEPLRQMGVDIQATQGCAPLTLQSSARPLRALEYTLPVASAQVKSCLLLAALAGDGETTLIEPGPSRDHTERMLRAMGVKVESGLTQGQGLTRITPPTPLVLSPLEATLPGDISAAAFLIVAGLIIPGSRLTLRGIGLNPTRTGLLEALVEMGADLCISNQTEKGGEPLGDLTVGYSSLHGTRVSGERVVRMIDEFPAFAAAAAYAHGTTLVADAQELRHKESDRITLLGDELRSLGVSFTETPDGFIIEGGGALNGGVVQSHGDHRLAMSLAVAGLAARASVTVHGALAMQESFPEFIAVLQALGASVDFS